MEKITLNVVFAIALVLKTVTAVGANNSFDLSSATLVAANKSSSMIINNGDSEESESDEESEEVDSKRSNTRIQNIVMAPASNEPSQNRVEGNNLSASMKESRSSGTSPISIIPMAGSTGYQGEWNAHVRNAYSLGLALEISTGSLLAIELEGGYGNYTVSYLNFGHNFNKYDFGGNAKFYLTRGVFEPFVGLGVMGSHYENMARYYNSSFGPVASRYDETIGSAQLIAGGDLRVSSGVAIGVRASYMMPMFNRPGVLHDGNYAYPNYEDASLINSAHYRLMGALKFTL